MSPQDFKELVKAQRVVAEAQDALAPKWASFQKAVKEWLFVRYPELKNEYLRISYDVMATSCKGIVQDVNMKIWVMYKPSTRSVFSMSDEQPEEVLLRFTPEEVFGWGLTDLEKIGLKYK